MSSLLSKVRKPRKTKKVEPVEEIKEVVQESVPEVVKEVVDVVEMVEEVKIEIVPEPVIVPDPPKPVVNQDQEIINQLKEKLINGTITDGEAAEYRALMAK